MRANRLLALVFFAFVAAPLVLFVAGVRQTTEQNRRPVTLPSLTRPEPLDPDWWERIGGYYRDRVAPSAAAVRINAEIKVGLFDTSTVDGVDVGADGWLFLTSSWEEFCEVPFSASNAAADLEILEGLLGATGRHLVVAFAPGKWEIHPEQMGRLASQTRCAVEPATALRRAMADADLDHYVDGWEAMERHRDLEGAAYPSFDSHWLPPAAGLVGEAIVDHAAPGVWDELTITLGSDPSLGLGGRVGLPRRDLGLLEAERPGARVERAEDGVARVFTTGVPGTSLVALHDSFWDQTSGPIAASMERAVYLNRNRFRTEGRDLAEDLAARTVESLDDADVLVYQTAARSAPTRLPTELPALQRRVVTRFHAEMPFAALDAESGRLELGGGRTLLRITGSAEPMVTSAGTSQPLTVVVDDGGRPLAFHVLDGPLEVEVPQGGEAAIVELG